MHDKATKGVILAGGLGTRLSPLTEITNKHLLPIGQEPMIWHSIRQLVDCGILNILIIISTHHMGDIVQSLGSGTRFGCDITYRVQDTAGGIADALTLAQNFTQNNKMVVLLGDNIFEYSIAPYVQDFLKQEKGARVLLKEVGDPMRYGIASLDETFIINIEEKPNQPKSDYAVVGCYMYDSQVFDMIDNITPSERGEMEITAVNNLYIESGQLQYSFVHGNWTDAGTLLSLNEANQLMLKNNNRILK